MRRMIGSLAVVLLLATVAGPAAAAEEPAARGVFFFSPTCSHCEKVMNEDLPGIFESHGGAPEIRYDESAEEAAFALLTNGTFELLLVNTTLNAGYELFAQASEDFAIPNQYVPRLVMGEVYYLGSTDIPAALPDLIDQALEAGATDWPLIVGIDAALAAIPAAEPAEPAVTTTTPIATTTTAEQPVAVAQEETTTTVAESPFDDLGGSTGGADGLQEPANTVWEKFTNDLAGNVLAVIVLLAMMASLPLVFRLVRRGRLGSTPGWLVPLLAAAGVVVAIYLTYVESTGNDAVCGPVGNCNAVQESKFALLFGVIHVGLVGLISYAVVIATWLAARLTKPPLADWATVALGLGALGGVAFSIYLTFLEPFVIGATCIWCVASAVIVTALFWITARPAWEARRRL